MADKTYGRFRVVEPINRGGMAQVYRAVDLESSQEVALKVLLPQVAEEKEYRLRFQHEVQAQEALDHENLVKLFDHGIDEEEPWLAMELVDGPTLKGILSQSKRVPARVAVHVVTEVLRGLEHAHAKGLVHRDVKPSNIMMTSGGKVKLADFGIATAETFTRLTQTGGIIGTPAYMSPEQASGEHADKRTDLFAMGVILYEMLVGRNPFQTDHPAMTLKRVMEADRAPLFELVPSIPAELEAVVDNLMERNVIQRYGDATEVLRDLETARSARIGDYTAEEMQHFVADPQAVAAAMEKAAAQAHFEKGIELYREGQGNPEQAIWELYQAVVIDPTHQQARNSLEVVALGQGYRLEASDNPKVKELRDQLDQDPENANLLVQLAKLYKLEGNYLQVIRCYVRWRKLHAQDPYLANQMNTLIGAENLDVFDRTRSLVARRREPEVTGVIAKPAADLGPGQQPIPGPRVKLPPRPYEQEGGGGAGLKDLLSPQVLMIGGGLFVVALVVRGLVSAGDNQPSLTNPGELAADIQEVTESLDDSPQGPADTATAILSRGGQKIGKRPKQAEAMFQRFIDEYPEHPRFGEAVLGKARALEAQGRRDEALDELYLAIPKMSPKQRIAAWDYRVRILVSQDRIDDAVAELREIRATGDPEAAPRAGFDTASILYRAERHEEALDAVLDLDASHPGWKRQGEARMLQARILVALEREEEAVVMLDEIQSSVSMDSSEYRAAQKLRDEISD